MRRTAPLNLPAEWRLLSSQQWCRYFQANAKWLLDIPWELGPELTEEERTAVAESMRGFQLGESSEGRHLLRGAQAYALRTGDRAYVPATRLFIAEEQRHARDLGRFLTLAGMPLLSRSWPDTVFRRLRHLAGLELSIAVLITAEIIAKVYYAALRRATGSRVLRRLCDQILHDEFAHVCFQAQRLALLRRRRPRSWITLMHRFHHFFFGGTCLVVWWKHARALAAGGLTFSNFWVAAQRELGDAQRRMDPRAYPSPRSTESALVREPPPFSATATAVP